MTGFTVLSPELAAKRIDLILDGLSSSEVCCDPVQSFSGNAESCD